MSDWSTREVAYRKVTPTEAAQLMELNAVNRALRHGTVDSYRRDMEMGRWQDTGEPIKISRTGRLIDGQHRMVALAGSGVEAVEFLVVSGLDDHAQEMMDQGATRGVADALRLAHGHVKNATVVAALVRWVAAHPDPGMPGMLTNLKRKVSRAEGLAAYADNPDIQEAADGAVYLRKTIPGSASAIGYAWLFIHRADPEACNEFFGSMVDFSFSQGDDPRKAALRRLVNMTGDSETRGDKATSVAVISVLTRAWNLWRKGEEANTIAARNNKGQPIEPVRPI